MGIKLIEELMLQLAYLASLIHQAGTKRQLELTTEIIDKDFEAFANICHLTCKDCNVNTCSELMNNVGKIGCGVEPNPEEVIQWK